MSINIEVPIDKMRERSLFIMVPMFGGQCYGTFTKSISDLTALCTSYGIKIGLYFLFNESLIQRARNYAMDEFARSDFTHALFIDADVGFEARDVIAMLALQEPDPESNEYDILCAPYPKKNISWEKIKIAVDKGMADEDPNNLSNFVGDYVFNPVSGASTIRLDEPAEVLEAGTGFMMIRRATIEKFEATFPELRYKPDHVRTAAFDGSREITLFFDCVVDPNTRRYLSEDYYFCQKSREAGMKVWLCPWIQLNHTGSYVFGGSLSAIASIGASATYQAPEKK